MSKKSKQKKIIVIFGTRPEAIKMAPVVKELERFPASFKTIVCVTAQHREMLDEVLKLFNIKPRYDLDIMRDNQSLFEVTTKGLIGIGKVLKDQKPDLILVQGDTTTSFAASLAAFYLKIPIGHIEAGLRTKDKHQPFPEEINRRLTSHLADFHFAPTKRAVNNLVAEGISRKQVFLTGNTIVDAFSCILRGIKTQKVTIKEVVSRELGSKKLILVTAHRRENFGQPIKNICLALKRIIENNKDVVMVYPVHPNPNITKPVTKVLAKIPRVKLIKPLDYKDFVYMMNKAYLILTDSGGVQEESSCLGKPVLVMRERTERQEIIEAGMGELVGTDVSRIVRMTQQLLKNKQVYSKMAKARNLFGKGNAAYKIVNVLQKNLFL